MKFKSHNFWCKCLKCGQEFQTVSGASLDGVHLLLSKKDHQPAVVICDDFALKEVWAIAKRVLFPQELFESEIARRVSMIFGEICDLAPDLSRYDMSGRRWCSRCGSSEVDYGPTNPPIFQEVDAPIATHKKWEGLNEESKLECVRALLETCF